MFLGHNFGTRKSHKTGSLDWRQEPGNLGQKCVNLPSLWRHPKKIQNFPIKKNQKYKTFRYFKSRVRHFLLKFATP